MEFEDILSQVGGYGRYQKQLVIFFFIPMTTAFAWLAMDSLFVVSIPDHWCYDESVANSNLSASEQKALFSALKDPSCTMYDVNYTDYMYGESSINLLNETKVVPCSNGWQYDKSDYESTATTKWNLVCDDHYFPSLVLTLECVGSLIFTPFYGFLADRYGRKRVYLFVAAVSSVTEMSSVMTDDFTTFAVLRTIHGGVIQTLFTQAFLIILEIVESEKRGEMNGLYNNFWTLGQCILPLIAYLSRTWVNLSLISSISCAFNLLYWKFLPESPSWLVSVGRYEEATTILEQMGIKNGKPQDRTHLFKQIQTLGLSIQSKKDQEVSSSGYLLFKSSIMRQRFLILVFCWMAFDSSYFGLMYNVRNLSGNEFLNFFLLSIVEVPGNIIFWLLMDKAGRRWTSAMGFFILGLVCLGPITGFQYSDIIFSMFGKLISTGNFMVTDQQATELFPTAARSFGISAGKTLASAFTIAVPFFADLGAYGAELPFIVMACIALVAGILASFLPETLNVNLSQTITDAEGIGKDEKYFSWIRQPSIKNIDESSASEVVSRNGRTEDSNCTEEIIPLSSIDKQEQNPV